MNGSLRDNVPDWYVLGYFMTSYLKTHYGPAVWAKVLDKYYRFPFYPFSFSNGIRRSTGLTVEQVYAAQHDGNRLTVAGAAGASSRPPRRCGS